VLKGLAHKVQNNVSPVPPLLIVTKEEVFLVQAPFVPHPSDPINIVTSMRRPLHPGPWLNRLTSQDRHCFLSHIPELGVFVVGSPIGHVGIFSLYYTKHEGVKQPRYGFKLEYLLPFQQSNENEIAGVPPGRLVGVTVGPVQGMLDKPEHAESGEDKGMLQPRRWRILMYYMCHTVLSFEISKPRRSASPGLSELVI
jgi:hypothetical protein